MAKNPSGNPDGDHEYTFAVGGPKGGVGKSTIVCAICAFLSRYAPRSKTLVLDAAVDNHNTVLHITAAQAHLPNVDVGQADDPETLRSLRDVPGYRYKGIDLPAGLKSGEMRAILGDPDDPADLPKVDLLIIPVEESQFAIESLVPAVEDVIAPSGVNFGVVLSRVSPQRLIPAGNVRRDLHDLGIPVFDTLIRSYRGVVDAQAAHKPLYLFGGRTDHVRAAEDDFRALTHEVVRKLGTRVHIPTRAEEYQEEDNRGND